MRLGFGFGGRSWFPGSAVVLDFENSRFRILDTYTDDLTAIPGYVYGRTGEKREAPPFTVYAAGTPALVRGLGYYSRGAFTNKSTNVNLNPAGLTGVTPASTATAEVVLRANLPAPVLASLAAFDPSGVVTALVRVLAPAAADLVSFSGLTGNTNPHTLSVFAYVVSGTWTFYVSSVAGTVPIASGFARTTDTITPATSSQVARIRCNSGSGDIYILGNNMVEGAVSGPCLPASGSSAADSLALTVPSGDYTATYTFDDGTIQNIATTVASNTFTLPTTTLNRPLIKRVVLV
jgi:hypothetical protein